MCMPRGDGSTASPKRDEQFLCVPPLYTHTSITLLDGNDYLSFFHYLRSSSGGVGSGGGRMCWQARHFLVS